MAGTRAWCTSSFFTCPTNKILAFFKNELYLLLLLLNPLAQLVGLLVPLLAIMPWYIWSPGYSSKLMRLHSISEYSDWVMDGIILCMCSANGRRRYIVMSPLIGWAHTKHDPWWWMGQTTGFLPVRRLYIIGQSRSKMKLGRNCLLRCMTQLMKCWWHCL